MRVTIMRDDDAVVVDGVLAKVDCSDLPTFFCVIQWDGVGGWIEMKRDPNGLHPGNLPIHSLLPYQVYVDRWSAVRAEAEHEKASFELTEAEVQNEHKRLREVQVREEEKQREAMEASAAADREVAEAREAERAELKRRVEMLEEHIADMKARTEALKQ